MSDFLPRAVREEMEAARKLGMRRKSRLRVMAGDDIYPILRVLTDGFTLDADEVAHLRGLIDIFDGSRHLSQCLIVASEVEGHELVCVMKRMTTVRDRPALDYVRDEEAPQGYLPRL